MNCSRRLDAFGEKGENCTAWRVERHSVLGASPSRGKSTQCFAFLEALLRVEKFLRNGIINNAALGFRKGWKGGRGCINNETNTSINFMKALETFCPKPLKSLWLQHETLLCRPSLTWSRNKASRNWIGACSPNRSMNMWSDHRKQKPRTRALAIFCRPRQFFHSFASQKKKFSSVT